MGPMTRHSILPMLLLLVSLTACGKQEAAKPPERITNVTATTVARKDLPVTETAVGAETAIVSALGYDPTRLGTETSYIRLPFPEHVAARLKVNQPIVLSNFNQPERTVRGHIREIRPGLNVTTVSREVIVAVPPTRDWRPEGSVRGEVTLDVRRNAIVVPENAVVLRPAGRVVYVLNSENVKERPVKTGIVREGWMEITDGLSGDEKIVVDGAALLSDGAKVKVREASAPGRADVPPKTQGFGGTERDADMRRGARLEKVHGWTFSGVWS